MKQYDMRFAGTGGQGVILASVIMAEAAMLDGYHTIQSQAYGAQARGGASRGETIVSRDPIGFSKVTDADMLLCLSNEALAVHKSQMKKNSIMILDASLDEPEHEEGVKIVKLPILSTTMEKIGKAFVVNIVAVGAVEGVLHLFTEESVMEAVKRRIPKGTEELNLKALRAGLEIGRAAHTDALQVTL